MSKNGTFYSAPQGARREPNRCMGHCGRPVIYGDRCPECQRDQRQRQRERVRQRKRRKRR